MNLRAGFGRAIYFIWLLMTLVVSLVCDVGLAFDSAGGAAACVLLCTLPLLIAMIGIVSASKYWPIAAMIGSGSMVAWIMFVSVQDIVLSRGTPRTSIVREGWWWLYFAINAIQLTLAANQFRQSSRIQHQVFEIAQSKPQN
jgi:uncharacterized membrane protein